ncbi:hypothetical protein [Haloplanus salilacus]
MTLVPHVPADEPTRDRTLPDFDEIVERIVYGDPSSARGRGDRHTPTA